MISATSAPPTGANSEMFRRVSGSDPPITMLPAMSTNSVPLRLEAVLSNLNSQMKDTAAEVGDPLRLSGMSTSSSARSLRSGNGNRRRPRVLSWEDDFARGFDIRERRDSGNSSSVSSLVHSTNHSFHDLSSISHAMQGNLTSKTICLPSPTLSSRSRLSVDQYGGLGLDSDNLFGVSNNDRIHRSDSIPSQISANGLGALGLGAEWRRFSTSSDIYAQQQVAELLHEAAEKKLQMLQP